MVFFEWLGIAASIMEIAGWLTILRMWLMRKRRDILLFGKRQPKAIPVLDDQLKKIAGKPNKAQRLASTGVVKGARAFVQTRAFEHLVQAVVNHKSRLHKKQREEVSIAV
jgi:hypothetical protein